MQQRKPTPFMASLSPQQRTIFILLMVPNLVIALGIPLALGWSFPAKLIFAIVAALVLRNAETTIFKRIVKRS